MDTKSYDAIVIGTGPGGEGAAIKLAKSQKRVAVIEKYTEIGGACSHWGTIPSKSLRHVVQQLADMKESSIYETYTPIIEYPAIVKSAEAIITKQVKMRQNFYEKNNIDIYYGHARFLDKHNIEILDKDDRIIKLKAKHFVIAAGCSPYHPPEIDFTHSRIFDSDSVLSLDHTPNSAIVYGAGVIGCEYASTFRSLGIKVNLINTKEKLLDFLDDEITDALSYHLREQGILIRHNEVFKKLELKDDCVILHLKSGKQIKADILLWANGRTGNTKDLGLEKVGIPINERQQIEVNEYYQTHVHHIYAVGDIIGYPSLASAAYDQGRFASTHIVDGKSTIKLAADIPTGIYTSPEISSIGKTEKQLTEEKIPYEVGHAFFKSIARAQITGRTVGMLKILFHRETLKILGIHCFGSEASEIIHIGQAIMSQKDDGNSLLYFINTTFNYPTMAEAYRVAALNGFNRL